MEKDILGNKKIAVIGAGHMGRAIIHGFIKSKKIKRSNIFISNKSNNVDVVKKADYVLIAVKPLIIKEVLKEIKMFTGNKIIMSVAAGVGIKVIEKILGKSKKIIRLMPNIPVSENKGVIGFYTNKNVSNSEKDDVIRLISLLGKVFIVKKEEYLDTLTLVVGCGPAISAYFIDLISNCLMRRGFSQTESMNMSLKIFKGTADYLEINTLSPAKLMKFVATKGGMTEVILSSLNKDKLKKSFEEAMENGYRKIRQLKEKIK